MTKKIAFLGLMLLATLAVHAQSYKVGDKVTDFKLKNVDGKDVSLAGLKGAKGAIIVFTCNHCPYAIKYEERVNELSKKFAAKGWPLLAINPNAAMVTDDNFENMVKNHKKKKFDFPYLNDESQAVAKAFGAERTPHTFVLQKKGNDWVVAYIGAIDDSPGDAKAVKTNYVEKAIGELEAGKPVSEANTKAIGCGIKWKKS